MDICTITIDFDCRIFIEGEHGNTRISCPIDFSAFLPSNAWTFGVKEPFEVFFTGPKNEIPMLKENLKKMIVSVVMGESASNWK